MKIKLVEGQFTDIESIDIITRLIQVEIKFHEGKIEMRSSKNERWRREEYINKSQKNLHDIKQRVGTGMFSIKLEG